MGWTWVPEDGQSKNPLWEWKCPSRLKKIQCLIGDDDYTSLISEALKITSKFYSIKILELVQKRDHLASNPLFILFDLFFAELRQISSTLIFVIYFIKYHFFRLMTKFLHWFYKIFQLYKIIALIISSVLLQHISEKCCIT